MMQITLPYLLDSDRARIAEIKRLREQTGQRNVTDVEIIREAVGTGLRHDLETMRMVAEAYQRTEEQADADHP